MFGQALIECTPETSHPSLILTHHLGTSRRAWTPSAQYI